MQAGTRKYTHHEEDTPVIPTTTFYNDNNPFFPSFSAQCRPKAESEAKHSLA